MAGLTAAPVSPQAPKPAFAPAGIMRPGYKPPAPAAPPPSDPQTTPNPAGFTTRPGGSLGTGPTTPVGGGGGYSQTPGSAPIPGVTPTGVTWGVDPTGKATPYTPQSDPWGGGTRWGAGDPTDLHQLGQDRFLSLLRALKGEGLGGGVGMPREPGLTMAPRETPSTMADRAPAEAAAFGRAKDRTAKVGGSAIDSLKDKMSSMGMGGSTNEANGVRDITQTMQGELGEVIRQQTEDSLDRTDQVDDRNLATGVQQRGQDINQNATQRGGNIQERGQDFQGAMNNPQQQMIMQLLSSFYGGRGGGGMMPGMF